MDDTPKTADEGRKQTVLFAHLLEILVQNAVMMLGGMQDRSGRSRPPDLNSAEMMIDMIAVLQKKTKGNLSKEEDKMISGALYQLQSAFAEVASKNGDFEKARKATAAAEGADDLMDELGEEEEENQPPPSAPSPSAPQAAPAAKPAPIAGGTASSGESKVKFTKKYS